MVDMAYVYIADVWIDTNNRETETYFITPMAINISASGQ